MTRLVIALTFGLVGLAGPLLAQQMPAIRPLGAITKVSPPDVLGSVSQVRALTDGGVIVNDWVRHQVVLLDRDFKKVRNIVDASTGTGGMLGGPYYGLLAYKGDSSLVLDPSSLSMLVVDASGEIARVMALPSVRETLLLTGSPYGTTGIDARGRIVFTGGSSSPPPSGQPRSPQRQVPADSVPLRRVGLATRAHDIVAYLTVPGMTREFLYDASDQISGLIRTFNPVPIVDGFALMPDGRVAVVRGTDYHVDWLGPDGKWTSTARIPFNWERLDDAGRRQVADSAHAAYEKEQEQENRTATSSSNAQSSSALRRRGEFEPTVRMVVPDSQDYRPAFRQNSIRSDTDGNLWVRTTMPSGAGAVYNVINGNGRLVDRVKLPFGRVISGFGPGVVYMGVLDVVGARLEVARIR